MEQDINELKKEFNIAMATIRNGAKLKLCLHPHKQDCKVPIIDAHSLQRQGALKILEHEIDNNRFLYSFTEREHNSKHNFLDFKKVGRKSASTFNGFCTFHDTTLFKTIENDPEITNIDSDEHCFLHSYRSFSHSYHRKHEELNLYETDDEKVRKLLIKIHGERSLEYMKEAVEIAVNDLVEPKRILDEYLINNNFSSLQYLVFEYDYTIPIACAGSTSPSFFPNGETFNHSIDPNFKYENVFTTILPFNSRSVIILSALPEDKQAIKYLDMIDSIKYELEQQKALSFHVLSGAENAYLSPQFYDKKSIEWKKAFCNLIDQSASPYTPIIQKDANFGYNFFSRSDSIKISSTNL